jgi:hypothetical protein
MCPLQQRGAIHSGHPHIRQNDRDVRLLAQDLQGRLAADRRVHGIAIREQILQSLHDLRLIVDTKNFHRLTHG